VDVSIITGTGDNDILNGTAGDDTIYGLDGNDLIHGLDGNDTIYGGNESDTLNGDAGSDQLYGGANPDALIGGLGNDYLDGGDGLDVAIFAGSITAYSVDYTGPNLIVTGPDGIDTLVNIERLQFDDLVLATPGPGAQTINGTPAGETLSGGAEDDWIHAGAGDDTLQGGAGNNVLDGGTGTNTVSYADATAGVIVNLTSGVPVADSADRHDILINIQNVIGSPHDDIIEAGSNSVIDGGLGDDDLDGTQISFDSAPAGEDITISGLDYGHASGGDGSDKLGIFAGTIYGSAYNDHMVAGDSLLLPHTVLYGGDGGDTLEGPDELFGGNGDDVLTPHGGLDTIVDGGPGFDYLDLDRPGLNGMVVDLGNGGYQGEGPAFGFTLTSIEGVYGSPGDDRITGDGGDNRLQGNEGNDIIAGGAGNDDIVGGPGTDVLTGGSGDDTFIFKASSESTMAAPDLITDFAAGDRIYLAGIDADTTTPGDQAFHLGPGGHAGDIQVVYEASFNQTTLYLYTNNGSTPAMRITLLGDHSGLTAADFVL
jgi:Ca2+-binding RTX toxin-like protein